MFQCDICKIVFVKSSHLVRHKQIHSGQKKNFNVKFVKKHLLLLTNLAIHKQSHFGQKQFQCDICKKAFITSSCLITHK